jgi:two-component sensor histidine kinase
LLGDVLDRVLAVFGKERFLIKGRDTWLNASNSLRLTMVLHELATNAVKYGALSKPRGQVRIAWKVTGSGRLKFSWQERGGPMVSPPERKGFGSLLIERSFAEARFKFARLGLTCTWEMST